MKAISCVRLITVYFLCGMILTSSAFAAVSASGQNEYEYPELSVVPRASDRLQLEAIQEPERVLSTFLPIQLSAATTLAAGLISFNSEKPGSGYLGIGVGGGWLLLSTFMEIVYRPYDSAHQRVKGMPKTSVREQLTRERIAEEEIRSISSAGQRIKWLSFLTQFGASVYMLSQENFKLSVGPPNYLAIGVEVSSLALSFAPLIFGFHWHDVYEEQRDYKKRIYAPVARATILMEPVTQKVVPGMVFSMRF